MLRCLRVLIRMWLLVIRMFRRLIVRSGGWSILVITVVRLPVRSGMWLVFTVLLMVVVVWVVGSSVLFFRIVGWIILTLIRFVVRRG